jgi:thiol-disulfide isomerase/thioredoxin
MKYLIAIIALFWCSSLFAQTDPVLLGKIKKEDMMKAPYNKWFEKEYNSYETGKDVLADLKKVNWVGFSIQIFLGTWCGDSHREVPRFLKVLDQIGFPADKVEIIAVNTGEGVHKQSPAGEEKGKYIFKVPTFIVYKDGAEINRIVEYPVESLERDLIAIVSASLYLPNYRSYSDIIGWLQNGVLADKNISIGGLAEQIRYLTKNAGEITSVAYVLINQGKAREALALYKIAYLLYPDTINYYGYIETLYKNGEKEAATDMLIKYLSRSTDKQNIEWALELYDKIKQN